MGRPVLFLFLVAASVSDLRSRYIDNFQNLLFMVIGLIFAFLERGAYGAADGLLSALGVFVLLYMFYAGGCLGAGDIKFIMAIAAYTGHEVLKDALIPVTVFSILTLTVIAVKEGRIKDVKLPMALPVSMGIILRVF